MSDTKNIHEGHRDRLRNKFLKSGFESFDPHNIFELLLFYSIPRKDTNELAHQLLDHFGSLRAVFEASFEELLKVKGISKNSATLIKMVPKITQEYVNDSLKSSNVFDTADKIGEFFVNKYLGVQNEVVYAMLLNDKYELLELVMIHEGSVNSSLVPTRKIVDAVVKYNASSVILAHNHPNGLACPSTSDINTTIDLIQSFRIFDIKIAEHFVVAGNKYVPIVRNTPSLFSRINTEDNYFESTIDLKY